jgi:uncharacterized protein (DUF305 family)
MNKKILVYGLLGLLSSGAAAGFVVANSQQGQALPASRDSQQPRSMRVDQHFIEMMIPHHRDAIAMADLALTRAKRPEVKRLAEAIKKDQAYEIQEMRTWYKQWYGKEVPAPSMAGMGMGQGMMGNPQNQGQGAGSGMMGMGQGMNMKTDLEALKKAPDFDKEFVRQMVPHHQMAVMMAQMASKRATRPEIRTLAQSIIKSQNAEIAQMQGWQQAWDR